MRTITEMKERVRELGYSYAMLSKLSGVPLGTVQKIFGGVTASPRYDTLRALEDALYPHANCGIAESLPAWGTEEKQPGSYTLEDYYRLPDDQRVELIDGYFYDMSAPTTAHQIICGLLHARLLAYVSSKKGPCLPLVSPVDVQLDCDDRTMVQPDVLVVCDLDKVINRCVYGAPDFVIEILSPSTRKKDLTLKLNKYINAGVREYWLIDPQHRSVLVYDFTADPWPTLYGFDAKIPVAIWGGDCVIDFQEIDDAIRFLYEKE